MAAKNVELRQNIGGAFNHADSLTYIRSHWDLLIGKPSTYPPATHEHGIDDINNLKEKLLFYVEGNSGGTSGSWTGSISGITELFIGLTIAYKINTAGASTTNLNINGYGNVLVRRNTGNLTTHLPVGTVVILTYDGTYWVWADYDATEDYNMRWQNSIIAGQSITRYKMLMEGIDGKFYPLFIGDNTTVDGKTISTQQFKINGVILWYLYTTTISADGTFTNIYSEYYTSGDAVQRNFNKQSGWAPYKAVYLKGTINSYGHFVLDNTTLQSALTQDLPTTDDGFVYILLGYMNNTTTAFRMNIDKQILHFKNGKVRPYADNDVIYTNDDRLTDARNSNDVKTWAKDGMVESAAGNLNDLIQTGFYQGSSLTNAPTTGWYFYIVSKYRSDNSWVSQIAISFGSGNTGNKTYTRSKIAGSWSAWVELYSTGNKPSMADLGGRTSSEITTEIANAIASLVDSSPGTLDTLNELAAALGDNPNFATDVANAIAAKVTANTAITGATKTKITYDAKGLVTGGADLVAADIPDLDWAKITTGKPTTLNGYGITDAPKLTVSNTRIEFANSDRYLAITYDVVEGKTNIYVRHNSDSEKQIFHSGSPMVNAPILQASNYISTDKLYLNQILSDGGYIEFAGLDFIDLADIPLINVPTPVSGDHAANMDYVDNSVVSLYSLVTSSFTLAISDKGKFICMSSTSARTITIPPNSSVAFPINTEIHIARYNTGTVQILAGSGVTILSENSKRYINARYQAVTIKKIATDTWILFGALAS